MQPKFINGIIALTLVASVSCCICQKSLYDETIAAQQKQLDSYAAIPEPQPETKIVEVVEYIHEPTFYDSLTEEEIHLIELTVENEVGLFSDTMKRIIATAIYNRVLSSDFPNTPTEVLLAPNQFYDGQYPIQTISEDTKRIVKEVFSTKPENVIHEAVFYYTPNLSATTSVNWFENSGDLDYLFTYSEELHGTTFSGKFFKIHKENENEN